MKEFHVKKKIPKESSIVNRARHLLMELPFIKFIKTHGDQYMPKGTPDLIGCCNGRGFALEAKRPGNVPTQIQEKELSEWANSKAITGVFTTPEEAVQIVRVGCYESI